jgi:hypothetical protein
MGDTKDQAVAAALARQKEMVAQEVEQHKDEDVDLEDVSGGWSISYTTDPAFDESAS